LSLFYVLNQLVMKFFMKPGYWLIIIMTVLASCSKQTEHIAPPDFSIGSDNDITPNATTVFLSETFETGTKTAYSTANVTLGTGSWSFNDALIGNTTSDRKVGAQSARIRNTGSLTMNFNISGGASTVTVAHAKYGSDANSTWELWVSYNSGSTYAKVGSTITTSSTTLQTATFNLNVASGTVRLSIRKISGGTNRINIDNVVINSPDTGGGGGTVPGDDDHMLMGNPSNATADVVNFNNYLMPKTYFKLAYNRTRATPSWVSWHVGSADLGSTPRQDDFRADNTLPVGWYQVGATSYSGSGFDRGHNCPSADRTATVAANSSTFLMTNMIPQAPNNNQQTWANLENYTRSLVTAGNEVYVIMGSYGSGGTGSNGTATTINNGNITVPSNVWKVIVVIPNGSNDLSRVTTTTRVIAVNTPNINTINSDWRNYRVSVDAIEAATGYDILSNLPLSVQSAIESVVDNL
jgi:endonuclease G